MVEKLLSGKITSKGQLTLPIELRDYLQVEEGDRLEFIIHDEGGVSIIPRKKKSLRDVVGILKPDMNVDIDLDAARERAREVRAREVFGKGQS